MSTLLAFVTLAVIAQQAAAVAVWGQCTFVHLTAEFFNP
jgi:hypothetical protein